MYKIEKAFEKNDFDTLANYIDNSLTDSAIKVNLDILDTINRLRACGFEIVSMTGSGSTVFAISNRKLPYKLYKKVLNKENYEIIKIVNQI
jgi:4-diphosphocytidyl-2-C-methyl-D-erythritol kinase/energy-coupling factor transport system substrate-specific component